MYNFRFAHASAARWQEAARACLIQMATDRSPANLGFLYVTDLFAENLHDILTFFKRYTGIPHWVGSVGVGICSVATEYFDIPAMAMMIGNFPEDSFRVFKNVTKDLSQFTATHQEWYTRQQSMFAIVHGDPRNGKVPELILKLSEALDGGFLVGGMTSSRLQYLQIADDITDGGLSGVMFANQIQVATRLSQGCSVLGPQHRVTEGNNNVITRLDHRAALDVFKEDIGKDLAKDLNQVAGLIFIGIPVVGSDTGDYVVRNLIGIDVDNKLLAMGDIVQPGMSIFLTIREATAAQKDLSKMLEYLKTRVKTTPKGGIYYSCVGRGEHLFGKGSQELNMIHNHLGEFPLVGFFASGEIFYQRLYGYAGTLTLFL